MLQLDGLRALAVALVAYEHWLPEESRFNIPMGFFGVQVFFVISGFLISSILVNCRSAADPGYALRSFYARRFLRIFPLYYLTIAIAYALDIGAMRPTVFWHLTYMSNFFFFWKQQWYSVLSHFWSLAVEEQFYLFWPTIVLFVPSRYLLTGFLSLCYIGLLSIIALPLLFPDRQMWLVLPNYNFLALGLGAMLSLRNSHPELLKIMLSYSTVGLVAFPIAQIVNSLGIEDPIITSIKHVSIGLISFRLIDKASSGYEGRTGRFLSNPILVYFGRISYGLYLIHTFAYVPTPIANVICKLIGTSTLPLGLIIFMKFWISILLATLSWYLFEKRINSLKRYFPYRRKSVRTEI